MKPKLKNFFAIEPMCKVHGSAKKCALGKPSNFSKKAEIVFNKISSLPYKVLKISKLPVSIKNIKTPFSDAIIIRVRGKNTLAKTRHEIKNTRDTAKLTKLYRREKEVLRIIRIAKSSIVN